MWARSSGLSGPYVPGSFIIKLSAVSSAKSRSNGSLMAVRLSAIGGIVRPWTKYLLPPILGDRAHTMLSAILVDCVPCMEAFTLANVSAGAVWVGVNLQHVLVSFRFITLS
jgi:hypothetical protein